MHIMFFNNTKDQITLKFKSHLGLNYVKSQAFLRLTAKFHVILKPNQIKVQI